jgi:hypothetical protein
VEEQAMIDFILLMHNDSARPANDSDDDPWGPYIERLKGLGRFRGGSAVGGGVCVNKAGTRVEVSAHIGGFITVQAESLEQVRELLDGNPVFEAGGTVEIRELPRG